MQNTRRERAQGHFFFSFRKLVKFDPQEHRVLGSEDEQRRVMEARTYRACGPPRSSGSVLKARGPGRGNPLQGSSWERSDHKRRKTTHCMMSFEIPLVNAERLFSSDVSP